MLRHDQIELLLDPNFVLYEILDGMEQRVFNKFTLADITDLPNLAALSLKHKLLVELRKSIKIEIDRLKRKT